MSVLNVLYEALNVLMVQRQCGGAAATSQNENKRGHLFLVWVVFNAVERVDLGDKKHGAEWHLHAYSLFSLSTLVGPSTARLRREGSLGLCSV
jgi:hypothetical protein